MQFETEGDEIETTPLTHDSNQLETCVTQGRLTMMLPQIVVSVVASCKSFMNVQYCLVEVIV